MAQYVSVTGVIDKGEIAAKMDCVISVGFYFSIKHWDGTVGFYKGVIDTEIAYFFRCVLKHHINIF